MFERGEINWNTLPSPVPESFKIDLPIERIARRNEALIREFEQAEEAGVVVKDEFSNWNILKTKDLDLSGWMAQLGVVQTDGADQLKKIREILPQLKERAQAALREAVPVRIEYLHTVSGSERQVMLDFYLLSPVLNELVHQELCKRRELEQRLLELEQRLQDTVREKRVKNDFFNAVFTGVLTYGRKTVFAYEEYGIEQCLELQNSSMKYGQSGAYQAFLTYQGLDDATKEKIDSRTRARLDEEDCAQVRKTVEALEAEMPKKIQGYLGIYDELDPMHEEIEAFYKDFMKTLHHFKMNL